MQPGSDGGQTRHRATFNSLTSSQVNALLYERTASVGANPTLYIRVRVDGTFASAASLSHVVSALMSFDDRIAAQQANAQATAKAQALQRDEERQRLEPQIAKAQAMLPELVVAARRFVEVKRRLGYNPERLDRPHSAAYLRDAEIQQLPIGYYGPTDPIPWGRMIEIRFDGELFRPSLDLLAQSAAVGYTKIDDVTMAAPDRFAGILDGFAKLIVHLEAAGPAPKQTMHSYNVALADAERTGRGWFRRR